MKMLQSEVPESNLMVPKAKTQLSPEVSALDLRRLRYKYTATSGAEFTEQQWDFSELEYRKFLELKKMYPATSFVPSQLVDKIWHAHILDTRAYREDC